MKIKGLYCILPEFDTINEYVDFVKNICEFNPDIVQLRIKKNTDRFFYEVAIRVKEILLPKKIPFIIDDRVDIAISVYADGVHLGQDDLPPVVAKEIIIKHGIENFIIGYSTHSIQQAKEALKLPVDYISIGPVFPTETKLENPPVGVETVAKVKSLSHIPVVAIGGINETNIYLLKKAMPDAIAVISAIKNPDKQKIDKLKSIFI